MGKSNSKKNSDYH